MARKSLSKANVFRASIKIRACGVPQSMHVEVPLETRSLLPLRKGETKLARGQAPALLADKQRSVGSDVVAFGAFLFEEFFELGADRVGKDNFLGARSLRRAFEDAKPDVSTGGAVGVEDVADIERENLVFSKASSKRKGKDHMVSPAAGMLSGSTKKQCDFPFCQGSGRASDAVSVVTHALIQASFRPTSKGRWR
jgi:hypothetical protein